MLKPVTALVPMKGFSQRVPKKNTRVFAGKPLYYWIIEALLKSDLIDKIAVDTDCPELSHCVKKDFPSVQILIRPEKIRGNEVPMNQIIEHNISKLGPGHYLQTHSTNPVLTTETIDLAIKSYFDKINNHDSLFSVSEILSRLYWPSLIPINHNPKSLIQTQDLPSIYEENSCIYIFSDKSFHEAGSNRIGISPQTLQISKFESWDIDTIEEFYIGEKVFEFFKQS